jgi:hypothetical protein
VDVGISFEGSAPDIGPFEYSSTPGDNDGDEGGDGDNSGNGGNDSGDSSTG